MRVLFYCRYPRLSHNSAVFCNRFFLVRFLRPKHWYLSNQHSPANTLRSLITTATVMIEVSLFNKSLFGAWQSEVRELMIMRSSGDRISGEKPDRGIDRRHKRNQSQSRNKSHTLPRPSLLDEFHQNFICSCVWESIRTFQQSAISLTKSVIE